MDRSRAPGAIAAGAAVQLMLGCLYAWSVFSLLLAEAFPQFTATELALSFTIAVISYCCGGYLGGWLSERISRRVCLRLAAAAIFAGLFGASFMEGLPPRQALLLLYGTFGVLMGTGNGLAYNICVTGIPMWYPDRMGLVCGILMMSYGAGSLLLGLLAQALSAWTDVFSIFRLFGAVSLATILAASLFLRDGAPDAVPDPGALSVTEGGDTPAQMLRRPSFWTYFLICVANSASGLLIVGNAAGLALFFGAAAWAGPIVSVFNSLSRPICGMLLDRLGPYRTLCCSTLLHLASSGLLILAAGLRSPVLGCTGIFAIGACYGASITASSGAIRQFYGPRHYPVNYSIIIFCMLPGSLLGPLLSGLLQDSGGGFRTTFSMMAAVDIIAIALLLLLHRQLRRETAER